METPDLRLRYCPEDVVAAVEAIYDDALGDLFDGALGDWAAIDPATYRLIEAAFHGGLVAASVIAALQALGQRPCICPGCHGLGTPDGVDRCDRCGGHGLARPGDAGARPFVSAAERIDGVLACHWLCHDRAAE